MRSEVGNDCCLPDSCDAFRHRQWLVRQVDAVAIVCDVAVERVAEHDVDLLGVGRPHGKAQPGDSRTARCENLSRPQPPRVGEVVLLDLRVATWDPELERTHTIGLVRIVDLRRHTRHVRD